MFSTTVEKRRLDLLHLEEYEVLTEENQCDCMFTVPGTERVIREKGRMYVCSKSIIFEAENIALPIIKFLFKSLVGDIKYSRIGFTKMWPMMEKLVSSS